MSKHTAGLKEFKRLRIHFDALMDENPAKAIKEARNLPDVTPDGVYFTGLKAGILVDAGFYTKNKQAIKDGVALFKKLIKSHPKKACWYYNLGNGLTALANLEPYEGCDWYLKTSDIRREARKCLQHAISVDKEYDIISQAYTNSGNALWDAHRWVEAYDAYNKALEYDSTNAVARTGAVRVLLQCIKRSIGDKKILRSVAARHQEIANKHSERIKELAGAQAEEKLSKLLKWKPSGGSFPDLSQASEYEQFVATHRLALSLTIEGLDCSLKRWDSLRFKSIHESCMTPTDETDKSNSGVPPLFAMFNVIKSDFLAARYLAYQALYDVFPESGLYSDTLDYAVYGITPSMLSLAQRACMDVLDKIANATSAYFIIPDSHRTIYFNNRWFAQKEKGKPLAWHPLLHSHVNEGNTAIIALAELSLDIQEVGALYQKTSYRHSSTHRFTVLHDIGCNPSRSSQYIEHCKIEDFKIQLIESLQLARAAILYFVEMISIHEDRERENPGIAVEMSVPDHHWIRGEDEEKPSPRRRRK